MPIEMSLGCHSLHVESSLLDAGQILYMWEFPVEMSPKKSEVNTQRSGVFTSEEEVLIAGSSRDGYKPKRCQVDSRMGKPTA